MTLSTAADLPISDAYSRAAPTLGHCRITLSRYFFMHVSAAMFPLTAGLIFYGWRAGLAVAIVMLSAAGMAFFWRRVGIRGGQLDYAYILWLALLLSLILPAHLAGHLKLDLAERWPILPAAGALLVIFCWILGGLGLGRIHPVVVTYLILIVWYGPSLTPQHMLQRNRMVLGDVLSAPLWTPAVMPQLPWYRRQIQTGQDALTQTAASENLQAYTTSQVSPDRAWLSLEGLLRDRMPPLEDLILGAVPGPIGTSSGIAVIVGGLFLLYRRLIDFRIPLLIILSAFVALLVLPIPVIITDKPEWRWLIARDPTVGWPMAITFANYQVLASPLLFVAFFLATAPAVSPLTCRGRALYSLAVGVLAALFQLYVSPSFGCYLALMIASLLTPAIDKWIRPRTLV